MLDKFSIGSPPSLRPIFLAPSFSKNILIIGLSKNYGLNGIMFAVLKKNRGSNELFQFMNIFNEDDCYVKPSRL